MLVVGYDQVALICKLEILKQLGTPGNRKYSLGVAVFATIGGLRCILFMLLLISDRM